MNSFFSFLKEYWQQLLIIVSAIGFTIAKIIEVRIKKREVRFNFYYKEKVALILNFFALYERFHIEVKNYYSLVIQNRIDPMILEDISDELQLYLIKFRLLTEEHEYDIFRHIIMKCSALSRSAERFDMNRRQDDDAADYAKSKVAAFASLQEIQHLLADAAKLIRAK